MTINRNTPIYIAGHEGLLGSAFLRLFQGIGFKRLITASHAQLELKDSKTTAAFFSYNRPEIVILAAGYTKGIEENRRHPADMIENNLAIQQNVIRRAALANVKKLVFFGSSCMYPRDCKQPMREEQLLTGQPEPTSVAYALAKLAGVHQCLAYNRQLNNTVFLPVIPNSVYGPHDQFNTKCGHVLGALITRFHRAKTDNSPSITLWGSGKPRREFIHADDVAHACYLVLQSDVKNGDLPINIGTERDIPIQQLAAMIAQVIGYRGEILWDTSKPDGAPQKLLDSSRLRQLGWQPTIDLETGIKQTYEWYRNLNEPRT